MRKGLESSRGWDTPKMNEPLLRDSSDITDMYEVKRLWSCYRRNPARRSYLYSERFRSAPRSARRQADREVD